MSIDALVRRLKEVAGREHVLTSPEKTFIFGADASRRQGRPLCVVRPGNEEQVAAVLAEITGAGFPVYPRGRGTGVVGGAVPDRPGVVVSTGRLKRILDISPADFVAVAEPGVALGEFKSACRAKGLFYPPDPASEKAASLGGTIVTNAGGPAAVKYGVTRQYVLGLRLALADGRVTQLGSRAHKNAVGLDLVGAVVGSEGTLGVVTQVMLKLLPHPRATASLAAAFADARGAGEALDALWGSGLLPCAVEFFSGATLGVLRRAGVTAFPSESGAALLLRFDGTAGAVAADLEGAWAALAARAPLHLDKALDETAQEALWEPRRRLNQASYLVAPDKLSDDIAVPRGRVGEAVFRIESLAQREDIVILVFGHAGDGNLHVNIMHHATDAAERGRAETARQAVLELAVELGGTVSGEHGVGLSKLPFVDRQVDAVARELMRGVKAAFDPRGLMNPGKAY